MAREARKKRALNREPTSLATLASISAFEAIDTSQIDLALLDIDNPPQSSLALSPSPSPSIGLPPFDSQYPSIESDNDDPFDTINTAFPSAQEGAQEGHKFRG